MTAHRAADLPEGSVVVDDNRCLVWIAIPRPGLHFHRWIVSGSESFISDQEVDGALRYTATVLRVGDGSG